MKYFRLIDSRGDVKLAVETTPGVLADLTSVDHSINNFANLANSAWLARLTIDDLVRTLLNSTNPQKLDLDSILTCSLKGRGNLILGRPIDPPEVWAAGITYKSSELERRRESMTPDVYANVYAADRPELFLKSTSNRCVGPFDAVGIRGDSDWNVPEPELAFVLYKSMIIGYTIGNDMSSRSIEGHNPLYLPQAKIYERSCSIGPCVTTAEAITDPQDLEVSATITSNKGQEIFRGNTSTALMKRTCHELADWLQRHNPVPDFTVVLTGTSIVPPPDFTLHEGDIVSIEVDRIGVLVNHVVEV